MMKKSFALLWTFFSLASASAQTIESGNSGGTPGGSTLQLQYNNAGAFGGMAGTSWDNTNRSLTITGATVTTSKPVFDLTQTWNGAGVVFKGISLNVTDTASSALSRLLDLSFGGSTYFGVGKGAATTAFLWAGPGLTPSASNYWVQFGAANATVYYNAANAAGVHNFVINDGANLASVEDTRLTLGSAMQLGWTSAGSGIAPDSIFVRDAAGVLGLRGSSTTTPGAMSFYTYGASPPAAPAASIARIYADTSGAKIRLMVLFPSGAAQQIAIEP